MQPDALLCRLCARGSDDAYSVLHARYSQQVFAFVCHLLNRPGSVDDAEDLTQEILGKAFSNMSTRRDEGSFKAWLFRIARNHTFDHIRARRPSPASFDDPNFHDEPSNVISLQQEVEKRSEMNWLLAAMSRLPERQREALVLRELGGLSYDEIGDTLETTPEGVKQLIKRGRANVSQAAEQSGVRSKNLGRDLALATPIAAFGLVGGTGTAGAAVAGGTGAAIAGGKVAATVLAVVAVGTGSVVVGEKVTEQHPAGDSGSKNVSSKSASTHAVPAQSLVVGANAADRAKANKLESDARRQRAQDRRAKARARHAAAVQRAKTGRGHAERGGRARANGSSNSTGHGNSRGGSADNTSRSPNSGGGTTTGNTGGGRPSSGQGSQNSAPAQGGSGSGHGSANSNSAGGKVKD
jgi:RNA polymerase sigma-70 factor (ECF subfamily)